MSTILRLWRLWQLSRGHEFHATVYVIHAAVHLYHAAVGSLHQPRVEQNQLDLRECLKFHHPPSSDDEDDALMAEDA